MSLRTLPGRNRWQNMSGSKKITVAAVGTVACATVAGSGVFAAWTSSATTGASGQYDTAVVTAAFADTGSPRWATGVSNMIPGDVVNRYQTLSNTGTIQQDFTIQTTGAAVKGWTGGNLAADANFEVAISACDVEWKLDGGGSTCPAKQHDIQTVAAISTSPTSGAVTIAASPGKTYLKVSLDINSAADNATQGKAATVTLTATGTWRAASETNG